MPPEGKKQRRKVGQTFQSNPVLSVTGTRKEFGRWEIANTSRSNSLTIYPERRIWGSFFSSDIQGVDDRPVGEDTNVCENRRCDVRWRFPAFILQTPQPFRAHRTRSNTTAASSNPT